MVDVEVFSCYHLFQTLEIGDPVILVNVLIFRRRAVVVTFMRKFVGLAKV